MMQVASGTVYLVGAGPGAADLITLRGAVILRTATVIFHDALIEPELLREASPGAQIVAVGKRGYCVGSTAQEHINDALITAARAGHGVCRLKGGDPGLFARGGEEAEACRAAGVPVVIVPGVTAALGAAAALGVPLTHRAVGQSVTFLTGHHDPDSPGYTHDWAALAKSSTLAVYMGVRHLVAVLEKLSAAGLAPETPAVLVAAATTPREHVIRGTVSSLPRQLENIGSASPAVLIVGATTAQPGLIASALAATAGPIQ